MVIRYDKIAVDQYSCKQYRCVYNHMITFNLMLVKPFRYNRVMNRELVWDHYSQKYTELNLIPIKRW